MKYLAWDDGKNAELRKDRGIGFEEIVFHHLEGLPYQTLISSLLHKYASGRLKEV